ncbi:MAG: LPS assembly lipoprotein LptE [Puniceicoccales bacterium]
MPSSTRFRPIFLAVMALMLLLGACSHYQLGPPGELPFRTLYVAPAINRTYAPQPGALLTDQTISDLQGHSNVKIVQSEQADATLGISIVEYERSVGATQSQDTGLAQSYILTMVCLVTLTDNRTGEVLMETRRVTASQQAYVQGGFQIAEYQAMPVLTREMARKISNVVVSVW